jgi:hypothetical protein
MIILPFGRGLFTFIDGAITTASPVVFITCQVVDVYNNHIEVTYAHSEIGVSTWGAATPWFTPPGSDDTVGKVLIKNLMVSNLDSAGIALNVGFQTGGANAKLFDSLALTAGQVFTFVDGKFSIT